MQSFETVHALSASDKIALATVIVTALVGIIAAIISVLSLRQNSKMIENSTRPYITVYGGITSFQGPIFYFIIRNFGASSAVITKFSFDVDLGKYPYPPGSTPFAHIEGATIHPGQTFKASVDIVRLIQERSKVNFDLTYKCGKKIYSEHISVDLHLLNDSPFIHAATKDKELRVISYALQDMIIRDL